MHEAEFAEVMAGAGLAGSVVMAGTAASTAYARCFGVRDVASGAAMTEDTLFQIASMTKALVSVVALRLVEAGKLSLDAPLGTLLPELAELRVFEGLDASGKPQFRPAKRALTLRHLLTHTAGFGYEFMSARLNEALGEDRGAPATLKSLDQPLLFEPGDQWEYSISTDWAGRAVEAATGQSLGAALDEWLTGPLGMDDTVFAPSADQRARTAALYMRAVDGGLAPLPIEIGGGDAAEFQSGGGGLWSTAPDYLKFQQLILNRGFHGSERILSDATMDLLTHNQIGTLAAGQMETVNPMFAHKYDPFPGMHCGWSLAFLINPEPGPHGRSAGSLAWAGIANCHYWIDPLRGQAGVFMTQLLPFGDPQALSAFGAFEKFVTGMEG